MAGERGRGGGVEDRKHSLCKDGKLREEKRGGRMGEDGIKSG